MLRSAIDYGLYIDGRYCEAHSGSRIPVIDPATGEQWATIVDASAQDVDKATGAAQRAFETTWARTAAGTRGRLLNALADSIERRADELAAYEVRDNGKLLREVFAQMNAVPKWYRYFAGIADKIHGETIPMDRSSLFNYTVREPFGVVGCITPWNSPLLLAAFAMAPALAAGNTVVLKPSEHASVSSLEFARCFEEAGFPPGVFNVVTGRGVTAGTALAGDRRVGRMVFTGSSNAGADVAALAGAHFAYATLELGGKSPNIVFDDSDIDAAVNGLLAGIFAASGQSCIAGSRALIHRPVYSEVVSRLIERAERIRLGDPMDPGSEMGPLANEPHYKRVMAYVGLAQNEGARVLLGGKRSCEPGLADGLYVEPTIFGDVRSDMRIAREEVFGPLLAVIPFDTESNALAIANDTEYGLAAGVWTSNVGRAHRMAKGLRAGTVWINTYRALSPSMPFGGFGASGIGSENGVEAAKDFTRVKSIWLETEPEASDPFTIKV